MNNKIKSFNTNIYIALIYRLLVMMFIFQLCRVLFYWINLDLFPNTSIDILPKLMAGGVVFDLTAVLYINAVFILMQLVPATFTSNRKYQLVSMWVYFVTNSVAIFTNIADVMYYKYTLRRTSFMFFKEFNNEEGKLSMFLQIVADYWYVLILFIAVIYLMILLSKLVRVKPMTISKLKFYSASPLILLLGITLFIGGVRGGFAHSTRPITISNATQYIVNLGEESIVLNTPFSLLRTIKIEPLKKQQFFNTQKELEEIYQPIHLPKSDTLQKKNVVIVIIESFGKEYIGSFNKDRNIPNFKGYTPFLDSLVGLSTSFKYSLANGRKSIDAMASVFASIPSPSTSFVLTPYSSNNITSIFDILDSDGYNSSFFHGAPNGSMGFLAFSKKLGIDKYYGKEEYDTWRDGNSDFDGMWGVWDDKFLEYYSYELNNMKQPFISSVFTLSSHHPFKVPEQYEGKFDQGTIPIHHTVGYTDMALRNFFDRASKQEWYKNTLFVLVADHANQCAYPEYKNIMGDFEVPIIIFDPADKSFVQQDKLAAQVDITPTILGYLGYNKSFFSFGFNLMDNDTDNFVVNTTGGNYNLYYKNYLLIFDGNKSIAIYDYKKSFTVNILEECSERKVMEQKIKAFLQQYNNRMIDNSMLL